MTDHLEAGKIGEQVAANLLQSNGYQILEMNYKNSLGKRLGEIDIIAEDKEAGELVFVEVKTRRLQGNEDTLPEENITRSKLRKLTRIAGSYLNRRNWQGRDYRFDAVSVWLDWDARNAKVKHLKNIFL
ncbi:MAG: YraN family protein [Parcubacteria group bacterium]